MRFVRGTGEVSDCWVCDVEEMGKDGSWLGGVNERLYKQSS